MLSFPPDAVSLNPSGVVRGTTATPATPVLGPSESRSATLARILRSMIATSSFQSASSSRRPCWRITPAWSRRASNRTRLRSDPIGASPLSGGVEVTGREAEAEVLVQAQQEVALPLRGEEQVGRAHLALVVGATADPVRRARG